MKKHTGKILIIALATITAIIYFIASIEINKGIPPTPIEEELLFEVADSCVPAISLKEASREKASKQKEAEKAKEKAAKFKERGASNELE